MVTQQLEHTIIATRLPLSFNPKFNDAPPYLEKAINTPEQFFFFQNYPG